MPKAAFRRRKEAVDGFCKQKSILFWRYKKEEGGEGEKRTGASSFLLFIRNCMRWGFGSEKGLRGKILLWTFEEKLSKISNAPKTRKQERPTLVQGSGATQFIHEAGVVR